MIIDITTHPVTELLAILMFVVYVVMAARGNIWCWAAGFLTSFLYTFIFLGLHLQSQMFLNILYMILAVWGWSEWTQDRKDKDGSCFNYTPILHQIAAVPVLLAVIFVSVWYLPSAFLNVSPLIDASITVFSVYATFLTIYRRIESWIYWVILNCSNAYLFPQGELTQTATLYGGMAVVSIYGFLNWRKLRRWQIEAV